MSTETTSKPYTSYNVWDDEFNDDRVYIDGHVESDRRAIAVANRWARESYGGVNLVDDRDTSEVEVSVSRRWFRPDPQSERDDETYAWCEADHPHAEPVTVVTW